MDPCAHTTYFIIEQPGVHSTIPKNHLVPAAALLCEQPPRVCTIFLNNHLMSAAAPPDPLLGRQGSPARGAHRLGYLHRQCASFATCSAGNSALQQVGPRVLEWKERKGSCRCTWLQGSLAEAKKVPDCFNDKTLIMKTRIWLPCVFPTVVQCAEPAHLQCSSVHSKRTCSAAGGCLSSTCTASAPAVQQADSSAACTASAPAVKQVRAWVLDCLTVAGRQNAKMAALCVLFWQPCNVHSQEMRSAAGGS
eukprot:1161726-Pelagomonas_calceolata.AAC.8